MRVGNFGDVWNDMQHGVYDFTDNGRCVGCGNCCSNILPVSESEIKTIKRYIKANDIKEQRNLALNAAMDMTCPFMLKSNTNKKCTIYEVRPMICRYFKCDEPYGATKHDDMYQERRLAINVRETFYL